MGRIERFELSLAIVAISFVAVAVIWQGATRQQTNQKYTLADVGHFANQAMILGKTGGVEIVKPDGTRVTAEINHFLKSDVIVALEEDAQMRITFDAYDKNVLLVQGPAEFSVVNGEYLHVNLNRGNLYALLDDLPTDHFRVITPQALINVKGTHFNVSVNTLGTQAATYKGQVNIIGKGNMDKNFRIRSVDLLPGQMVSVNDDRRNPSRLKIMPQADFEAINSVLTQFDWQRPKADYARTIRQLRLDLDIPDFPKMKTLNKLSQNSSFAMPDSPSERDTRIVADELTMSQPTFVSHLVEANAVLGIGTVENEADYIDGVQVIY